MGRYAVKSPSIEKLKELARLSYNVRYWTIEFRGTNGTPGKLGVQNRENMILAEQSLDAWLKKNIDGLAEPELPIGISEN